MSTSGRLEARPPRFIHQPVLTHWGGHPEFLGQSLIKLAYYIRWCLTRRFLPPALSLSYTYNEDSELGCHHMVIHTQTTGKDIRKGPKQPAQRTVSPIYHKLSVVYLLLYSSYSFTLNVPLCQGSQGSQQVRPLPQHRVL